MTTLTRLDISHVRNIEGQSLRVGDHINLIHGANGSGKSSILESIFLLATGRSFRSAKVSPIIQRDSSELTVFGELGGGQTLGLRKSRQQKPVLKLQGEKQQNWVEVARILPVQLIDSATFRLLEGSPRERRRFLDWGVFHVEPAFVEHWRNSRKCIANRNLLLKASSPDRQQIRAWNQELAREAECVDRARQKYFDDFIPVFNEVIGKIGKVNGISLQYKRGWDAGCGLQEVLERNEGSDLRYGMTQMGPHRADIVVKCAGNLASDVLSRGQQKILVSALKLAQGVYQSVQAERACVFLVDDLPAELDEENRTLVCRFLMDMRNQVFLTAVEEAALRRALSDGLSIARFHVEHGKISA